MKFSPSRALLTAVALAGVAAVGAAKVERLTLQQMVQRTDGAVVGEIVGRQVERIDHPVDGTLWFTRIDVRGTSLYTDQPITIPITYMSGSPDDGIFHSEAPRPDETALGERVVVFYRWVDNLGAGVAGNALYAAHAGLFPVVQGRTDSVVLGRGEGYCVESNVRLSRLTADIKKHL